MDLFETLGLGLKPVLENIVSYAIYPDTQPAGEADLLSLHAKCMAVVEPLLQPGYIWQVEKFNLTASSTAGPPWVDQQKAHSRKRKGQQQQQTGNLPALSCLWGTVRWADNVEDEWWVVYLLRAITAALPCISAQVWDNDGEFLLIEAAYSIPRWLKPDTATNRVWLRGGQLHIIPQPGTGPGRDNLPPFPTAAQAIQILACGQVQTLASKAEKAIAERLSGFPEQAQASGYHRSKACLPVRLAAVLRQEPQLVAAAVEAFFYRDGEDMKAAARMSHFPPTDPRVTVLVASNRCQYAQLVQQRFAPPRGYQLPPPGHPLAQAADRGVKLTAGFEILATRAERRGLRTSNDQGTGNAHMEACGSGQTGQQNGDAHDASSPTPQHAQSTSSLSSVLHHPLWPAYLASLESSGFFQGQLPGSQKYKELMVVAQSDFQVATVTATSTTAAAGHQASSGWDPVTRLSALLSSTTTLAKEEDFAGGEKLKDDDDSWMEEMADQLEQELNKRDGQQLQQAGDAQGAGQPSTKAKRETEVDAGQVVGAMREFMDFAKAGLEGAEVPTEDGQFDVARFLKQLEHTLGMAEQQATRGGNNDDSGGQWETDDGFDEEDEDSSFFSSASEDEEDDSEEQENEGPQLLDTFPEFKSAKPRLTSDSSSHMVAEPITDSRRNQPADDLSLARQGHMEKQSSRDAFSWPSKPGLANLQEHWEVFTATDSDDEDDESEEEETENEEDIGGELATAAVKRQRADAAFASAYDDVLAEQLAGTTLDKTVERAANVAAAPASSMQAEQAAAQHDGTDAVQQSNDGQASNAPPLAPIDLDFNLVHNLLKSVSAQQGMAGPASNLAGLLGVSLPHGMDDLDQLN